MAALKKHTNDVKNFLTKKKKNYETNLPTFCHVVRKSKMMNMDLYFKL